MTVNVICVKHGSKYSSLHVNRLYNMVMRNLTLPHNFICFTENPTDINSAIDIRSLPPYPIVGWWWKTYIFNKFHYNPTDINLFFDLDMVIVKNIDHFIDYLPQEFVGLRDVKRVFISDIENLGSAVMKWPACMYSDIWDKFVTDPSISTRFRGDQDWIWYLYSSSIKFFPDEWIRSYKWEIRSRQEIQGFGPTAQFKDIKNPTIPSDTSVLAFHGYPQIDSVRDPVIVDNWK